MKGLAKIPSSSKLASAYKSLQSDSFSERDLAIWSQWSRLDPRLGEILVKAISSTWKNLSPVKLNAEIKNQPWPAALGVLLDFAKEEILSDDKSLFKSWSNCVM